ncbi:uncharacterized protein Z520_08177 [Fonsecaea multimorphosa CBS 102226]|uniref:Uncharacterized protein n=1 Tax=Fonsecaea multimorphosa CBS 102226 TaxID=1442371 RepID=A0A0D2JRB9_9EURO|nr:uncharacterized protein Z520_08177 [Fonsecaea multimorphosa CBS 102226]KIX95922.1 hypothetical protein Z520_08177 [Fonsecaea multimorphosa CBS 102226]OAL21693.1 hypothetical protein AYO22_07635 [Fonsecaea multimorphosa]
MATLVNYNQSTFKNHAKPNKRRLQELQHSEARAHAARVAYWRKKGVPEAKPGPPQRRRSDKSSDGGSSSKGPSDDAGTIIKQESHKIHEILPWNCDPSPDSVLAVEPASAADTDRQSEQKHTPSSQSGSFQPQTLSTSPLTNEKWQRRPETTSFYDSKLGLLGEMPVDSIRLARQPTSPLFEPFDSAPVRQGNEVVAAMDHYIHNWAPSQRPGLKYQTKDNPLIRDTFPFALQNVELFEAAVALCLSFKAAGQNFQARMCNWSLYHKGHALNGIRAKLNSGCVDEAVILATVFLMIIDNVFLDVDAYEAHLHGLRKMVKAAEPSTMEAFGGSLLSFVSWAESNALLIFGDRIALHDPASDGTWLQYPSPPFPMAITKAVSTLTPGFQTVATDGHLSYDVVSILANTVRWTKLIDREPGSEAPSKEDQVFLTSLDPRLQSAQVMRLCRVSAAGRKMERAICKAVFIYHANLLGWTCRCSGYRRIVEELGDALRLWVFEEPWDRELWEWLALVTANAARRGQLQHLQMEVMAKFVSLGYPTPEWDFIRGVLKKFLLHSRLEREWKFCWETAMILRPG